MKWYKIVNWWNKDIDFVAYKGSTNTFICRLEIMPDETLCFWFVGDPIRVNREDHKDLIWLTCHPSKYVKYF